MTNYKNAFSKLLLLLAFLFQDLLLPAQSTYPVLETITSNQVDDDAQLLGALGNRLLYFDMIDDQTKLWVSDGTAEGTFQIGVAEQTEISLLARADSTWYFEERIGGDYHISALVSGVDTLASLYSTPENIERALYWNESLYYTVDSPTSFAGDDLVKFTPTSSTTEILFTSDFGGIKGIGATSTEVMFIASMDEGKMLGKTDGTLENTATFHMLYDPGSEFGSAVFMQSDGEKMFFAYHPNNNPYYLWVSNGTSEGTIMLQEYYHPFSGTPDGSFAFLDGKFYFILRKAGAPSGTTFDLHVSDGTIEGTFNLNPFSSGYLNPRRLTVFNNKVYFNSLRDNWALRSTDGTTEGTETVIFPYDYQSGGIGEAYDNGLFNNSLILRARGADTGSELYISDGTLEGTTLLSDINPGEGSSYPSQFTQVGNLLFFLADVDDASYLWVYDPDFNTLPCAGFTLDSVAVTNVLAPYLGSIEIIVSGGTGPFSYQLNNGMSTNNPLFENLMAGTYDVLVTDANGCTLETQAVVDIETNVLQPSLVHSFQVFPNPVVSENLNVNLSFVKSMESVSVTIYNIFGQSVLQQDNIPVIGNEWSHQIKTRDFSAGNYFIVIASKTQQLAVDKFTVYR